MSGCVDKYDVIEIAKNHGLDGEIGIAGIDDALNDSEHVPGMIIRATVTMRLDDLREDPSLPLSDEQRAEMGKLSGAVGNAILPFEGAKGTFFSIKSITLDPFPPIPLDGSLFDFMKSMSDFLTLIRLCVETYTDRCSKDVGELVANLLGSKVEDTVTGLGQLLGMLFVATKAVVSSQGDEFDEHLESCDRCRFMFKGFVDRLDKVFFIDRRKAAQA
jgi:hypothetical protein